MKFCSKPWTRWYIIDAENGGLVWPCEWMSKNPVILGSILDNDIEELLNNEDLKKFRESVLDGSYCMCDVQECEFLSNDKLPDLTEEEIKEITKIKFPEEFNIAYDESCNHACPSCRKNYFSGTPEYYQKVQKIHDKMLPYYNKAKYLSVNGRGDFFACKSLLEMLGKLKPEREDFVFDIETNGSLFNKQNWKKIEHLAGYEVLLMVTVNSFHDSTYRYLNGYANHVDQVIENLKFIRQLRREKKINDFSMSIVVQEANFRELPEYVERCLNEFEADHVRIRGIMKFGMDEMDFWFKDIFNPLHPCYKEAIEILHHPIMQDERVWYWEGDYEQVRKPVEFPSDLLPNRHKDYYNLCWRMMQQDKAGELDDKLAILKGKKIVIYGAALLGEYLLDILQKYQYNVSYVIDQNREGQLNGKYAIYKPEKGIDIEGVDIVINSVAYYHSEVLEFLKQVNFKGEVICLEDIICC